MSHTERVVILVDMDCFYCQVEENLNPKIAGKPIAVVQYNAWRGGGIIAVNYPARDRGVTRHMRGDEAKEKCPEIELVKVPNVRGKADLSKYRDAGKRVADVLQTFTPLLERASVDEAYLDITGSVCSRMEYMSSLKPEQLKNTHVVGRKTVEEFLESFKDNDLVDESNLRLAVGGAIAEEIRAAVYERTGYRCSAGIAHNKILAKLVCGLHKPNQQTILPQDAVEKLYENLPVRKIKSLGGKFGNYLSEKLKITNMGELYNFSERELAQHFDEKTASWLYNISRGIDREPVTVRLVSKSIGCCKKFPGRNALTSEEDLKHWLNELSEEISERLNKDIEENNRKAKQMVISFVQEVQRKDVSSSRSHPLNSYETERIMTDAYEVIKKNCMKADGRFCVKFLGISAGKFEDVKNICDISMFFKNAGNSRKSIGGKEETITKESCRTSKDKKKSSIMTFFNAVGSKGNEEVTKSLGDEVEAVKSHSNSGFEKHFSENVRLDEANELSEDKYEQYHLENEVEEDSQSNSFVKNLNNTLKNEDDCSKQEEESQSNSFFGKYFSKISTDNESNKIEEDEPETQSSLVLDKYDNPDTNSSESPKDDDEDCDSEDSISQELQPDTKNSYFQKYFQQLNEKRVFNTSIVLEETLETPEPSMSEPMEICSECNQEVPASEIIIHMDQHISETCETITPIQEEINYEDVENTRNFHFGDEDGKEVCTECGKRILVCDMVSHMDYHFALKIVREEADIYKPVVKKTESESKENKKRVNKASKRKVEEKVKMNKLTSFLVAKTEVNDNVPMETCAECMKRIRVDEFVDHMDFHVAKRLHLEINAVERSCDSKSSSKSTSKVSKSGGKGTKSNNKVSKSASGSNSLKSVSSFFKPT